MENPLYLFCLRLPYHQQQQQQQDQHWLTTTPLPSFGKEIEIKKSFQIIKFGYMLERKKSFKPLNIDSVVVNQGKPIIWLFVWFHFYYF